MLVVPAMAALGMYALVLVQERYVGGFLALLWLGIFGGGGDHEPKITFTGRSPAG